MKRKRKNIRLNEYDYSGTGMYFVTMCAFKRKHMFSKISSGEIMLSVYGKIIEKCFLSIPEHVNNADIDHYVIMPNYIHGIIGISGCRDTACRVPTRGSFSSPQKGSLSTIIRSFKSAVTRAIRSATCNKNINIWQKRFYEHIIRNENELNSIREYIINNPRRWEFDKENPDGITDKTEKDFWKSFLYDTGRIPS